MPVAAGCWLLADRALERKKAANSRWPLHALFFELIVRGNRSCLRDRISCTPGKNSVGDGLLLSVVVGFALTGVQFRSGEDLARFDHVEVAVPLCADGGVSGGCVVDAEASFRFEHVGHPYPTLRRSGRCCMNARLGRYRRIPTPARAGALTLEALSQRWDVFIVMGAQAIKTNGTR